MPYAIILDKDRDRDVYADYWPIVRERDTIDELRGEAQHWGNPMRIPKSTLRMEMIEPKSLINAETGETDSGAIYREWAV